MTTTSTAPLRRFRLAALLFPLLSLFFAQSAVAQDGKALFQSNCASCHNPLKDATGPALKGADARVPSKQWMYDWVHNPMGMVSSGDKYANDIYNKWGKVPMTAFPQLSNDDIDAIFTYVNSVQPPTENKDRVDTSSDAVAGAEAGANWIYVVATLGLFLIAVVLYRVNNTLRRAAAQKEGHDIPKEVPLYRNKLFIAIAVLLALALSGYYITNGAVNLGRQTNYMPEQPIFYSHAVHAGINQMNCLYCHTGAEKGRHAVIPSTNVCMNCHKQINEYTGAETHPLKTYEGETVDGTAEIQKLYEYAGWDPAKKDYKRDAAGNIAAKPVEWVKIHNLPDHVYFNHAQHVSIGKIACQRCHGDVQNMDEVRQVSSLSMGWCINCHRQTQVQFADNGYYQIFERYHAEIKSGARNGVTVEDIGGIECQKCHY